MSENKFPDERIMNLAEMQLVADEELSRYQKELGSVSDSEFFPVVRDYSLADYTYEVIMERIKEFEDSLDDDHEVAIKLASFGQSITMIVTDIGYSNPSTLVFYGLVKGDNATLIQHVNQLNFLLLAVSKADPEKPPRRIGFVAPGEDPEDQSKSQY